MLLLWSFLMKLGSEYSFDFVSILSHVENRQTSVSPPPLFSWSWILVFLCGKHHNVNIAPFLPSCCCFIAFFQLPDFNKPLYQLVTTQTTLVIMAALFNFLTGYLFEGEGSRRENRKHQLVASVSSFLYARKQNDTFDATSTSTKVLFPHLFCLTNYNDLEAKRNPWIFFPGTFFLFCVKQS